jgi:hypothetical protein
LYGKRPVLFGLDEAAIVAREEEIQLERKTKALDRKEAEKARQADRRKPRTKTKTTKQSDPSEPEGFYVPLTYDEP